MRKLALACTAVLLLAACSPNKPGESQRPRAVAQQPEYETGRVAFQKMYLSAREWAADAAPFHLESQFSSGAPADEGKAGVWRASFASPARGKMKMFLWSGLVGPDAPERGVSFSAEDSWSPVNTSTRVFNVAFLKIDSDKAYEVAQQHGGAKLMTKNPKQPVFFVLDWDAASNALLWHVIYGDSPDNAKLQIAVNATTGGFLGAEK